MYNYVVFFREKANAIKADAYIKKQPDYFSLQLEQAIHMLSTTGRIDLPRSNQLTNGDWSIWLEDENGERHNYILFVSQFERPIEPIRTSTHLKKIKHLVIVDPNGPRDTIGGDHPGYWSVESFASRMDAMTRDYFMNVISEIQFGAESKNYTNNSDGSVSIHINRPDLGYGIHVICTGKFI
jgi:hypothetical protein